MANTKKRPSLEQRAAYMRAYRADPERRAKHNAQTREWKRAARANPTSRFYISEGLREEKRQHDRWMAI
mgnify:CR=1 FL=1